MSSSLERLRMIFDDRLQPMRRRLRAAELYVMHELAPGSAAGVEPDQVASAAYQFFRRVETAVDTTAEHKFVALENIVKIENHRKTLANTAANLQRKREFKAAFLNIEQRRRLREAGEWKKAVAEGTYRPVEPGYVTLTTEEIAAPAFDPRGLGGRLDAAVRRKWSN